MVRTTAFDEPELFYMNNSLQTTQNDLSTTDIKTENGKNLEQATQEQGTATYRFGLMDLWSIRRNSRKFRIHNRIPRL